MRLQSTASALTQSLQMNTTPGDERVCSAPAAFLADVVLPQVCRRPRLAAIGRDVHPDDAVAAAGARTYKGRHVDETERQAATTACVVDGESSH